MKKSIFSLLLLILPLIVFSEEPSRLVTDFNSLEKGMSKEAVEAQYGLPDEYRSSNTNQYIYYAGDNQLVLIRFSPSSHLLVDGSIWYKNIEQWPVTTRVIARPGKTIQLSTSEASEQLTSNADETIT